MEEDTELEEGEALEGGPPVDDLDSRFDYLDTKIEAVLGHCQKEFQGSLYPDRLGSRYGGYGTFLPTHVRSAPVLSVPPPAPVNEPSRTRPTEGHMERGRRVHGGSSAASDRVTKNSPHDSGVKGHNSSNGVIHTTDGAANVVGKINTAKDGAPVDQKKVPTLTVRITLPKQGRQVVDKDVQKAMYDGFGLDHSSSPSADDDPDDDARSASEDNASPDRSPWDMIRIMTSHEAPHGGLLSPLPDLLTEPPESYFKPTPTLKLNKKFAIGFGSRPEVGQGSVTLRNEADSGKDGSVLKERKDKGAERLKVKLGDRKESVPPPDTSKVVKRDAEVERKTGKEGGTNTSKSSHRLPMKDVLKEQDSKAERLDKSASPLMSDIVGKVADNSRDLVRNSRKDKALNVDLQKGDRVDFPVSDYREIRKEKDEPVKEPKKVREASLETNLQDLVAKEPAKEKRKTSGSRETTKTRKEEEALRREGQKQQARKEKEMGKPASMEVVVDKELGKEAVSELKKKGSKDHNVQKEFGVKVKDVCREVVKESKKEKLQKELPLKDVEETGRDGPKDFMKSTLKDFSKEAVMDLGRRDAVDQGLKEVAKAGRKSGKKGGRDASKTLSNKERDIGLPRDSVSIMVDGGGSLPPTQPLYPVAAGVANTEMLAGTIPPVIHTVLDNWVQCDKCQQWRLCLPGIDADTFGDKWHCRMMTWLPGLNSCKYTEETTTAAVYAYLRLPNPATLQNAGVVPGAAPQKPLLDLLPALPSEPLLDSRILESKPTKVHKPNSKKGVAKKMGGSTAKVPIATSKKLDLTSVKSKSLNDVVQYPPERGFDKGLLDINLPNDVGYTRVMAEKRKLKEKEKLKRMRGGEGDDLRPQKQTVREDERNRASASWQERELGQVGKGVGKSTAAAELEYGLEENIWLDSVDPEPSKQLKGRLSHDASKADSGGLKRKKKAESSQDNDEVRTMKKVKGEETRGRRAPSESFVQPNAHSDDQNTHSLQYISDEEGVQEGESGDRAGINSKNVARGSLPGQSLKKVKVTLGGMRDPKSNFKREDSQDVRADDRKRKEQQKLSDVKCKTDYFEKHESSDSDRDKHHRGEARRGGGSEDAKRKVEGKGRGGHLDRKKRTKDEYESDHPTDKRRVVSKHDVKDVGASREQIAEEKKYQVKRIIGSFDKDLREETSPQEQPRQVPKDDRDVDMRGKKLFDDISGIARTYVQDSPQERMDDSPQGRSPLQDVGIFTDPGLKAHQGGSRSRSPTSSSSKVSFSAESSAMGSKGVSPIESTVSSSPVRSTKVDTAGMGRRASDGVQNHHTTAHSQLSEKHHSLSLSPKRSIDHDVDAQSDREGAQRQSHRSWDDRPHSPEPDRELRGSGRDMNRDTSAGRVRDDRYATSNSREGGDFRKYDRSDRSRSGRDDDRYWEEGTRETRAGSASYFVERGYDRHHQDRHHEDRHREREDSLDRYRDRDNRHERRGSREDRFHDERRGSREGRDRDRDRDRHGSRENWPSERGGDGREERYSRERSVRDDWGRPSSRESRLDKQGSLNYRDETRPGRDTGRERTEDGFTENKLEIRSKAAEDSKDEQVGQDDHEATPGEHKDDPLHRYEKNDSAPQRDAKFNSSRQVLPTGSHGWDGERVGVATSGRKDPDNGALRIGVESQNVTNIVNNRSRADGQPIGLGSTGGGGKSSQIEGAALDVRISESGKQGKDLKKSTDEDTSVRSNATKGHVLSIGHIARVSEGASGSPSKKEHAAIAQGLLKEAKDLKHSADRIKSGIGKEGGSTNVYLNAALKFLQAAHHLEMSSMENARQGDTTQSMAMYNDTAKLCDFCATTYERQKDLAAAALSHICAAVARTRVMMAKSSCFNRDCVELQNAASSAASLGNQVAAVQTPPTGLPPPPQPSRGSEKPGSSQAVGIASVLGESPSSSSASDVDNLNNHAVAGEKGLTANALKGTALSPLPGTSGGSSDILPPRLHSNYQRLIRNALDVHLMLESWTKAGSATAAAEAACAGEPYRIEGMLAIRRVGEIGLLENMDAVVRQVRLALEVIGH